MVTTGFFGSWVLHRFQHFFHSSYKLSVRLRRNHPVLDLTLCHAILFSVVRIVLWLIDSTISRSTACSASSRSIHIRPEFALQCLFVCWASLCLICSRLSSLVRTLQMIAEQQYNLQHMPEIQYRFLPMPRSRMRIVYHSVSYVHYALPRNFPHR